MLPQALKRTVSGDDATLTRPAGAYQQTGLRCRRLADQIPFERRAALRPWEPVIGFCGE